MNNSLPRMRTIPKAYKELKAADPGTSFTEKSLRQYIKRESIPTVSVGNKNLINCRLI